MTTHFVEVSSASPIGPRACIFCVEMPISAPKPNSPPSVNRVEALTMTAAESTRAVNRRAACRSRVTIASVWPEDHRRMCAMRLVQVVDDAGGEVERQVLRRPVLLGGRGARRAR